MVQISQGVGAGTGGGSIAEHSGAAIAVFYRDSDSVNRNKSNLVAVQKVKAKEEMDSCTTALRLPRNKTLIITN